MSGLLHTRVPPPPCGGCAGTRVGSSGHTCDPPPRWAFTPCTGVCTLVHACVPTRTCVSPHTHVQVVQVYARMACVCPPPRMCAPDTLVHCLAHTGATPAHACAALLHSHVHPRTAMHPLARMWAPPPHTHMHPLTCVCTPLHMRVHPCTGGHPFVRLCAPLHVCRPLARVWAPHSHVCTHCTHVCAPSHVCASPCTCLCTP